MPDSRLTGWRETIDFQLEVARDWRNAADSTSDVRFQFVSYFSAFNALYWLWKALDELNKQTGEVKQIKNLLGKMPAEEASQMWNVAEIQASIEYFKDRPPVRRMRDRKKGDQNGSLDPGKLLKERISSSHLSERERLIPLIEIVYLVRCNLVHGSKAMTGVDTHLLTRCLSPLHQVVDWAERLTKNACP